MYKLSVSKCIYNNIYISVYCMNLVFFSVCMSVCLFWSLWYYACLSIFVSKTICDVFVFLVCKKKEKNKKKKKIKKDKTVAYKTKEAIIRSRVKWFEEREKNTKYSMGLEKSRGNKKVMISIKTRNGNITHYQALIMRETVHCYSELLYTE